MPGLLPALRRGGEAPRDAENLPPRGSLPRGAGPSPRPPPRHASGSTAAPRLPKVRHDRLRRGLWNRGGLGGREVSDSVPDGGRAPSRRAARGGRARVPALRDGARNARDERPARAVSYTHLTLPTKR